MGKTDMERKYMNSDKAQIKEPEEPMCRSRHCVIEKNKYTA